MGYGALGRLGSRVLDVVIRMESDIWGLLTLKSDAAIIFSSSLTVVTNKLECVSTNNTFTPIQHFHIGLGLPVDRSTVNLSAHEPLPSP
jgi:hypothetical protein